MENYASFRRSFFDITLTKKSSGGNGQGCEQQATSYSGFCAVESFEFSHPVHEENHAQITQKR